MKKEAKTVCLHISINARTGLEIVMSSDKKKYPNLASTRFRIHSVFKNSHPGERIKKGADSFAGFTGYVWTEAESAKKKLQIQKYPETLWTGPKNTVHRQHTERGKL